MVTLALNMIVAGGEAEMLYRCLVSAKARDTFDELVIVNTSTDSSINAVASEFGAQVVAHQWSDSRFPYGNFSAARNRAIEHSSSDFIMWLDADDIILEEDQCALPRLSEIVNDPDLSSDVFCMPYANRLDHNSVPVMSFLVERIFRRHHAIRWVWPIHEGLDIDSERFSSSRIDFLKIAHQPKKSEENSAERNIRILRHEIESKGRRGFHNLYFLTRDLLVNGEPGEARLLLEDLRAPQFEHQQNALYSICMLYVFSLAYGRYRVSPTLEDLSLENSADIVKWLEIAIQYHANSAEPYFLMGELCNRKGNLGQAVKWYKKALEQRLGSGMSQIITYYRELPGHRLADIMLREGQPEDALAINKHTQSACRSSDLLREQNSRIMQALRQI